MMAKDKKENVEGGQLGIAKRALEDRKSKQDTALERMERGEPADSPKQEKPKEKESTRPPMSRKWTE
jgi:hypothetical protein